MPHHPQTSGSSLESELFPTRRRKTQPLQSEAFHHRARFILFRRRAGKIARLPQHVRDRLNQMLLDGIPYAKIIANLGEAGKGLNKDNLSRWRKADHQDWLAEQRNLQAGSSVSESSNQVKNVAFLLHELDADTLRATSAKNPDHLVRVFNLAGQVAGVKFSGRTRSNLHPSNIRLMAI